MPTQAEHLNCFWSMLHIMLHWKCYQFSFCVPRGSLVAGKVPPPGNLVYLLLNFELHHKMCKFKVTCAKHILGGMGSLASEPRAKMLALVEQGYVRLQRDGIVLSFGLQSVPGNFER